MNTSISFEYQDAVFGEVIITDGMPVKEQMAKKEQMIDCPLAFFFLRLIDFL